MNISNTIKRNKKYEIIIQPENDQYCGKCTYRSVSKLHSIYDDVYECLLFNKRVVTSMDNNKSERCGDCKILTERFMRMPELEEGR